MHRRLSVAWILMLSLAGRLVAQDSGEGARVAGWRSDLESWLGEVASQHYVLRRGPLPDSLRRAAGRFWRLVSTWSDERALAEMMRLAAMAGDGHTYVLPFGAAHVPSRAVPLRFYQFADGLYVIDAAPGLERWIGSRVLSLAGLPADGLLSRVRPFIPRDNDIGVLWAGPFVLRFVGYLEALTNRRFPDGVPIRLRDRTGRDTELALQPATLGDLSEIPKLMPSRLPDAPAAPLYLRDVATAYWLAPINDTVLYVQFNQVVDGPTESLAAFAVRLDAAIAAQRARLLLVDVRHNNGGNLALLDPLIHVLHRFTAATARGHLVVICGRNTFSAGQVFLARAEREAQARVTGEPSSSKPNFVGEENDVVLPWSGAIASISDEYHETIPGDIRLWIEPRPHIKLIAADYFANRDPVLDALLGRPRARGRR